MQSDSPRMARRALLTESEREAISKPESRDNPYVAVSRVRRKINEELTTDIEVLREHHPDLLEELRDVVCEAPDELSIAESVSSDDVGDSAIEGDRGERETSEPATEALREQTDPVREAAKEAVEQHWVKSWEGRRDEAVEALIGLYEELQTLPDGQQKSDFLELYDQYQGPYPEDEYPNAGTKKGGWYRKFVSECLEEMPGVERYGQNGRRWRYAGENDE